MTTEQDLKWTKEAPTEPGPYWLETWYARARPVLLREFREDGVPLVSFPGSGGFDAVSPDPRNRWSDKPIPEPTDD